ncbi:MAG: LamG domain-containing protein [Verrucomicrobia bacterium]|nr:LamG domain-containing protein [Verrucomicrobiota bacterium]
MNVRFALLPFLALAGLRAAETVAFFPFDEPVGLYPSSVLSDHGPAGIPLLLGPGGSIVPGKFGGAFSTAPQPPVNYPAGSVLFGLTPLPVPPGRTVEPLHWRNARFAALLTAGETHLRKEVSGPVPTATGLNLGAFDWTVEFWYRGEPASPGSTDALVFEIGKGPRAENDHVTALLLAADRSSFRLVNQPSGTRATLASDRVALTSPARWTHLAFVHDAGRGTLSHYVDGRPAGAPVAVRLAALPAGPESYFSLGRDARWERPLPGALDELRFSRGVVYSAAFSPPGTQVARPDAGAPIRPPSVTEPLRFAAKPGATSAVVVALGSAKHLLIDDALFPEHTQVAFVPTPPLRIDLVAEITGRMRKHLVAIDDGAGLVRLYAPLDDDRLGVLTSRNGLHFDPPRLLTTEDAGTPSVFLDPLAPPAERWKMISGFGDRGIFLSTSPDGYTWTRLPTAVISARSASQSNLFYDDQRGQYLGYHRTDIGQNQFGKTERRFVMTATESLRPPWPFTPLTQADYERTAATLRLHRERPWYLDNGPLTPGGIGLEWPTVFRPRDGFDPDATDIYVPKAVKYPWAPDTYLAFPPIYYHYEGTQPPTRRVLGDRGRARGSGPIETQLMTSRDGENWSRHPRPVWLGVGAYPGGFDVQQTYMAHGMIRRDDEIWMYTYNSTAYHSGGKERKERRAIFRTVSRLDRFVAAEAPYDREATLVSRPLTFSGKQLVLNVDTGASGHIQVGLRHPDGSTIPGFGVDECVFVNGNELRYPVEWQPHGTDVSSLAGRTVQLVVRLRGARLYSLQFVP